MRLALVHRDEPDALNCAIAIEKPQTIDNANYVTNIEESRGPKVLLLRIRIVTLRLPN